MSPSAKKPFRSIPVICYHKISPIASITPELFKKQLQYVRALGFRPVRAQEAVAHIRGETRLRGKPFLITFDDASSDFYLYAYPILRKMKIPSLLFPIPALLDKTEDLVDIHDLEMFRVRRGFLSLAHLKELAQESLVEFGGHTFSHLPIFISNENPEIATESSPWYPHAIYGESFRPGFPVFKHASAIAGPAFIPDPALCADMADFWEKNRGKSDIRKLYMDHYNLLRQHKAAGRWESKAEAHERIRAEIVRGNDFLRSHLGIDVQTFAYPWGTWSGIAAGILEEDNIRAAFTLEKGLNIPETDPCRLHRFPARGKGAVWLVFRTFFFGSRLGNRLYKRFKKNRNG